MSRLLNEILETFISIGLTVAYIANIIYAFKFWGVLHGLLNFAFPYAMIADIVFANGRF
jgi:hypothetical protein